MFTNLFSYEENENVVEFVEEETIETVEELDTFVDKVINFVQELGQVVVNTGIIGALLVGKAVKGVGKVALGMGKIALGLTGMAVSIVTYPIYAPVKYVTRKLAERQIKKTFKTYAELLENENM
jgi:hypothetical protein